MNATQKLEAAGFIFGDETVHKGQFSLSWANGKLTPSYDDVPQNIASVEHNELLCAALCRIFDGKTDVSALEIHCQFGSDYDVVAVNRVIRYHLRSFGFEHGLDQYQFNVGREWIEWHPVFRAHYRLASAFGHWWADGRDDDTQPYDQWGEKLQKVYKDGGWPAVRAAVDAEASREESWLSSMGGIMPPESDDDGHETGTGRIAWSVSPRACPFGHEDGSADVIAEVRRPEGVCLRVQCSYLGDTVVVVSAGDAPFEARHLNAAWSIVKALRCRHTVQYNEESAVRLLKDLLVPEEKAAVVVDAWGRVDIVDPSEWPLEPHVLVNNQLIPFPLCAEKAQNELSKVQCISVPVIAGGKEVDRIYCA